MRALDIYHDYREGFDIDLFVGHIHSTAIFRTYPIYARPFMKSKRSIMNIMFYVMLNDGITKELTIEEFDMIIEQQHE
jgi:hypothetical protein